MSDWLTVLSLVLSAISIGLGAFSAGYRHGVDETERRMAFKPTGKGRLSPVARAARPLVAPPGSHLPSTI